MGGKISYNTGIIIGTLFITTVISRVFFSSWECNAYSFDEGNYALAVQSYSIQHTRPHLPGYYLQVKTIRIISSLTGNVFSAMALVSALYSGLAAALLWLLVRRWFLWQDALLIVLLTMTNPLVWFYGCTGEIYAFDLFFSVALVYFGTHPRYIYLLPVFMAYAAGVRQSSVVLLLPLYTYLWYSFHNATGIRWKLFIIVHGVGAAVFCVWFILMIQTAGGMAHYLTLYTTHNPMGNISFAFNLYTFISYNAYIFLPLLIAIIGHLFLNRKQENLVRYTLFCRDRSSASLRTIMLLWIVPPVLFFILVHYAKGYALLYTGGIMFITYSAICHNLKQRIAVGVLIIIQALFFLFAQYKKPAVDTYVAPQYRTSGLAATWLSHMQSNFLMAQSHIRFLESVDTHINHVIDTLQRCNNPFFNKKYFFIDPTCPVIARSLQAKHPTFHFAAMDVHHADAYFTYHGLAYANRYGIQDLFRSSVIFGRSDLVKQYHIDSLVTAWEYGDWSLYAYTDDALLHSEELHNTLFLR